MSVLSTPRITPFLWFDANATEAADFYTNIFPNSHRVHEFRNPQAPEKPMVVSFELDGQRFIGLNGGPTYKFSPAISFVVTCATQEEIDYYWQRLGEGGMEIQCGWVTDKFGLSWQVVPANLSELLSHPKAMQAMLGMKKLNIAELQDAAQS